MNISATRFATHIRTWLLIAALTGLLIAIGAAIGGGALYLFVILAVGMNLIGYWFSDRIALAASRARPMGRPCQPAARGRYHAWWPLGDQTDGVASGCSKRQVRPQKQGALHQRGLSPRGGGGLVSGTRRQSRTETLATSRRGRSHREGSPCESGPSWA